MELRLTFTDEAIHAIAKLAVERKTGAREDLEPLWKMR